MLVAVAWALSLSLAGSAFASSLPADQEALILTRALAYDRNLTRRAGDELVLAVLVRQNDANSMTEARRIHAAFRQLEKHRVQGLRFRAVLAEYTTPEALEALVVKHDIDALYVSVGLEAAVAPIARIGRDHDTTTMGADSELVRAGLCLGVVVYDNRPRILLNRTTAEAEGASFGAGLLRLARVIN